MSSTLQIFIAVVTLLALVYVTTKVIRRVIELKYALVWYFVGILFLILDVFPDVLEGLSSLLGIALPINMLMFFGFAFLLMILYTFTIVLTNQDRRIKRLIQEVALANYRIEALEKALKKKGHKPKSITTMTADGGPEHQVVVQKEKEAQE